MEEAMRACSDARAAGRSRGVVEDRAAVAQPAELADVGATGRGVAVRLDQARVGGDGLKVIGFSVS
jgi:hypothetical protein